jgi:hypothetical protein
MSYNIGLVLRHFHILEEIVDHILRIPELLHSLHSPTAQPISLEGRQLARNVEWSEFKHGRGLEDGSARGYDFSQPGHRSGGGGPFNLPGGGELASLIDITGVKFSRANLERANFSKCSVMQAIMVQANLARTTFLASNLAFADLSEADLTQAYFEGSVLEQTILAGANLRNAMILGCNCWFADFSGADLRGAIFTGSNLHPINLRNAKFDKTTIWPSDFNPAEDTF